MNKNVILAVLAVLLVAGGLYWYMNNNGNQGTYAYMCTDGSEFSMSPSEDMSQVMITAGAGAKFSGSVKLDHMGDGAHYEGDSNGTLIVVGGAGEEMQLTVGQQTTVCNPKPNGDMAPWNWGDAAEGGGGTQDLVGTVSESIMGKWHSADDSKLVREFRTGSIVSDMYDNKSLVNGMYTVFTTDKTEEAPFPLQPNTVYVQIKMSGKTLNFKLVKLTPELLELGYVDREGVLRYTR